MNYIHHCCLFSHDEARPSLFFFPFPENDPSNKYIMKVRVTSCKELMLRSYKNVISFHREYT